MSTVLTESKRIFPDQWQALIIDGANKSPKLSRKSMPETANSKYTPRRSINSMINLSNQKNRRNGMNKRLKNIKRNMKT